MSRRQRARIVRIEPGDDLLGLKPPPADATAHGFVSRGDQQGRVLRLASGHYVLQLADGSTGALDEIKIAALLAAEAC